jgi:hypothetical protein
MLIFNPTVVKGSNPGPTLKINEPTEGINEIKITFKISGVLPHQPEHLRIKPKVPPLLCRQKIGNLRLSKICFACVPPQYKI